MKTFTCTVGDPKGKAMIRYNGHNYHLCKDQPTADQYIKDMNPAAMWASFTVVDWV